MVAPTIIRTVAGRENFLSYLLDLLPGARVARDINRNAFDTFLAACAIAGAGPAIHMEDDVILTNGFTEKAAQTIRAYPEMPIQFFSMRIADLTIGSRIEPGRTFLMGQCFYLPTGMSRDLLLFADLWPRRTEHPTGLDIMIADYLKSRRLKYFLHVPSLVQHRNCRSMIDPRRARSRQSRTFEWPNSIPSND